MQSNVVSFGEKRSYFSHNTPASLRALLDQALASSSTEHTRALLEQARMDWPQEPDVHIAFYKFLFVQAEYALAEKAVLQAIYRASQQLEISRCYWRWTPATADWSQRQGALRLALFSLKALGVIRLRQQKVRAAHRVLTHLLLLDPANEIGGDAFREIASNLIEDEA